MKDGIDLYDISKVFPFSKREILQMLGQADIFEQKKWIDFSPVFQIRKIVEFLYLPSVLPLCAQIIYVRRATA